jgi:hypothetical protein
MLIDESESLYNCKMHDLSSFSQRYHFLNRLLAFLAGIAGYPGMLARVAVTGKLRVKIHYLG